MPFEILGTAYVLLARRRYQNVGGTFGLSLF